MSSISAISSNTDPYRIADQQNLGQIGQDFKAIGSALQSGNLSTAQTALTTFQQDLQAASKTGATQISARTARRTRTIRALPPRCNPAIFQVRRKPLQVCKPT